MESYAGVAEMKNWVCGYPDLMPFAELVLVLNNFKVSEQAANCFQRFPSAVLLQFLMDFRPDVCYQRKTTSGQMVVEMLVRQESRKFFEWFKQGLGKDGHLLVDAASCFNTQTHSTV